MAGVMKARADVKEQSISAVITRADGRVENLGVISYHHVNPLRRILWQIKRFFGLYQAPAGARE